MTVAVFVAAALTVAIGLVAGSKRSDDGGARSERPTLELFTMDEPNGKREAAPAELTKLASSIHEGQMKYCRQPWSALLFDAGEPPSTPFSRSALRRVAANLPHAKRFLDGLLANIATDGCIAGFLALLRADPSYALS